MQAIKTKFLPYTATKPSRIKATTASGISLTVTAANIHCGSDHKHHHVAQLLANKLNWGPVISGSLGDIDVHVLTEANNVQNR